MRFAALLLIAALSAAGPGHARDAVIYSGEHDGFSRLVVEMPAGLDWSLGRAAEGYLLRFDNPGLVVDFARVFEMIPRTRLTDMRAVAPGMLALEVAADVHAEPFVLRPGVLVVDFRTGPPQADSPFEQPLALDGARPAIRQMPAAGAPLPTPQRAVGKTEPAPDTANRTETSDLSPPQIRLPLELQGDAAAPIFGDFLPEGPDPAEPAPPATTGEDPRLARMRSELMQQIGRAASQGLLEPVPDLVRTSPPVIAGVESAPGARGSGAGRTDEAPEDRSGLSGPANMRVRTSIDRGLGRSAGPDPVSVTGASCLPDIDLDLAGWVPRDRPMAVIATRRSALLDVRESIDRDGLLDMARGYLGLGFGAEARAVLDAGGVEDPAAAILRELGSMIDKGQAEHPELFDGQLTCPGRAALWAVLARARIAPNADIAKDAVIRSLNELPLHLRRHLGPMAAERFLAAGDAATARQLRNAVARVGERARTEDLTLLEAQLDLSDGQSAAADARLGEVLSKGGPASPEALALRLEGQLGNGEVPGPADLELAEALAFDRRGTALATRLLSAAIRGHAAGGDYATAFLMLRHHGLETQESLVSDLLRGVSDGAHDAALVQEAFSGILANHRFTATAGARLAVAERLAALGFAERSEDILDGLSRRGTSREKLVRARIALARDDLEMARQYLNRLDGTEADALRADLAHRLGDPEAAARYSGAAGDSARQAAMAWRARDWETVGRGGPEAQRNYAAMRTAVPAESAVALPTEPSLAGARSILEGSIAMRERLEELLQGAGE